MMKKVSYAALLVLMAILMQYCKKASTDDSTSSTTTTPILTATLNNATWTPYTVVTTVDYNSTTQNKVLVCQATSSNQRVKFTINQSNAVDDGLFSTGTYNIDSSNKLSIIYSYGDSTTNVYTPINNAQTGTFTISSVNSTQKTMTGTFSFNAKQYNYDSSGNITSIVLANASSGVFTAMPFTYKKE